MVYLSKGTVCNKSSERELHISHGRQEFTLTGQQAEVWRNGRFALGYPKTECEENITIQLAEMGLSEYEPEETPICIYRVLTRCIFCASGSGGVRFPLFGAERELMRWIKNAGLRLSTAELIFLAENRIRPTADMLYEKNRHSLTERIYTSGTIYDRILECRMEHAACRDRIVNLLLGLVKKKYLVAV